MIDAGVDLLTFKGVMAAAGLNCVRRYARTSRKRVKEADRLRAEEARRQSQDGREMVTGDFELQAERASEIVVHMVKKALDQC